MIWTKRKYQLDAIKWRVSCLLPVIWGYVFFKASQTEEQDEFRKLLPVFAFFLIAIILNILSFCFECEHCRYGYCDHERRKFHYDLRKKIRGSVLAKELKKYKKE